jgi:broad specificity phosphatase PhoE
MRARGSWMAFVLGWLLTAPASGQPAAPALVVVVRHAEKLCGAGDVALAEAGRQRAQDLAVALAQAQVGAIVSSDWQRTRGTAEPLAQALGIVIERTEKVAGETTEQHLEKVLAAVRRQAGKVVLVVGHSNTVPRLLTALGAPPRADLEETDYDNLFSFDPATGSLLAARYGAPDPATSCLER